MDSQHIQELILTWAPLVFFGIIVVLLLMTLRFMPRVKPAAIEKESASNVVWSDIAGVDEAKAELMEVVEFLKDRRRFERLGASIPKGVLLYGPPGTGKTLLAKAVASESGANFYSASASSFVEMFAGLGAARIRKLFTEARKNAPAIVFIDELDAVGRRAGVADSTASRTRRSTSCSSSSTASVRATTSSSWARPTGSRISTRRCSAPVASTARSMSRLPM